MHRVSCPFCGGSFIDLVDIQDLHGDAVVMACGDCGAIGPTARDDVTAAQRWNSRAGHPMPGAVAPKDDAEGS